MSLRLRLNLLITFLFLLALTGGSSYIINKKRHVVKEEMQSTTQLTSQLVELLWMSVQQTEERAMREQFVQGLNELNDNRHLQIHIVKQSEFGTGELDEAVIISTDAPSWFVSLVKPPRTKYSRTFKAADNSSMEIHIHADPSIELTEAWHEAKNMFLLLVLFVVTANIFIYLILGRDLAPIEVILTGLSQIEKGDYNLRLPKFTLPELDRISDKFNHMASVLQRSEEDNRYLTQHSLVIEEEARRHLAQELHDELGQSLTAVKAVAFSIQRDSEDEEGNINNNAATIISFVDRMYEVAHSMVRRLRPSILDELGLIPALHELIDNWNTRNSDAFCHFSVSGDLYELNDNITINIYRIIQESLTNAEKYARANEVYIEIRREFKDELDTLVLDIRDNGIGFDTSVKSKGLGILGIRERVKALNGQYELKTEKDKGVQIAITIPVILNAEQRSENS